MYLHLRSGTNNSFHPTTATIRIALNNSLKAIDKDILKHSGSSLTKVIFYGDSKYSDIQNHDILNSTITYLLDSKRFDCSLT